MTLAALIVDDVTDVFLNRDDFAESVTFNAESGPVTVTAIVALDAPIRDTETLTATIYTGELHIAESDVRKIHRDKKVPLTVKVRNLEWHVTSIDPPELGMQVFGIQRQDHRASSAVGLNGEGLRYAPSRSRP